jgi:hypothetical protein
MLAWLTAMTWLAIAQHDVTAVRIILIAAPMWTVLQVVLRFATNRTATRLSLDT